MALNYARQMSSRTFFLITAILGALLAAFFAFPNHPSSPMPPINFPGRSGTVLFLSNPEHGLSNVLLATSQALLTQHSDLEIHYASFKGFERDIKAINQFAITNSPLGLGYRQALESQGIGVEEAMNPPGLEGVKKFTEKLGQFLMPWEAPDFLALYHEIMDLIEKVDPAIIAVDQMFGPALNAVRTAHKERNYVVISPNALKDNFQDKQPLARMFWEYPATSSGYPYPVPLHLIPANILLTFRFAKAALFNKSLREKREWLKEHGMEKQLQVFETYHPDYRWISSSAPALDFPLHYLPNNVVTCGPIYLSSAPAEIQDPELASWLKLRPTVVINLGSMVDYDKKSAVEMVSAIVQTLNSHSDIQIIWKFNKRVKVDASERSSAPKANSTYPYSDDFLSIASEHLKTGRLRLENWLEIDPAAMMETGNIILNVHHGGANCFHETAAKGIPQVILPMWVDLYDFAVRAEYLGIGVWGNRGSAPLWTAGELVNAFERVLGESEEAKKIKENSKRIGDELRMKEEQGLGGRRMAANVVAGLARKD
ncbi:glycosyltransferase family 1 protein [Xylogone sp. PMI_703]|nr:glycosyltransferase family 1 protein [Xylogone sp. PMI_703]